ncbi:MAG: hypothetical protein JST17_12855 [Bacteroidetes bacterium]|nr:hypothetical protein [Bacteroidota bacterium]MBS1930535.1 hypothetical protein [Bacteroidota bacterium]
MSFENFDKKIKEAADHHHPAYEDKAWEKMEKLLDKHLPQEKDDKRKIIFLILTALLISGSTLFFLERPGTNNNLNSTKSITFQTSTSSKIKNLKDSSDKEQILNTVPDSNKSLFQQKNSDEKKSGLPDHDKYIQSLLSMIQERLKKSAESNFSAARTVKTDNKKQAVSGTLSEEATKQLNKYNENNISKNDLIINGTEVKSKASTNRNADAGKDISNDYGIPHISTKQVLQTIPDNKHENTGKIFQPKSGSNSETGKNSRMNRKRNTFFLTLSAGPDVSAVGIHNPGKLKPVYGFGFGISFQDKYILRTGFYTARKVYTAAPDEYHPPYNFWNYYPYLNQVNADCKVYEIPLMLSYNFAHSANHSIFGSIGISSYLMKRETYNYISKLPTGQTTTNEVNFENKNKHLFSVVSLSGVYQRRITKMISVTVEPYIKIPVDGIGYGKIHLNSTGILFSLLLNPFQESKKK